MTIGQAIKQLRTGSGLTQRQLADSAGIGVGVVSSLERDRRLPDWWTMIKLCRVLNISASTLATW